MQGFPIEGRNQPVDRYCCSGFLQACNLARGDTSITALQLNEAKVQNVGFTACDAESHGVDDAATRRPS
jgi:hypothetical protein